MLTPPLLTEPPWPAPVLTPAVALTGIPDVPRLATFAPVDTDVPASVFAAASPPTATAEPPLPPVTLPLLTATFTPGETFPVEAEPPLPPVAAALPPLAVRPAPADTVGAEAEGEGVPAVALPPTATAGPPLPPVASPLLAVTFTPAEVLPVEAEPPLPPVAVALPPVAVVLPPLVVTLTFTGTVGAGEPLAALPPTAVAEPPLPADALPLFSDVETPSPEGVAGKACPGGEAAIAAPGKARTAMAIAVPTPFSCGLLTTVPRRRAGSQRAKAHQSHV